MPISNKQRGKYFENKIADFMRKALNLGKHQCYRSSFSGARQTVEFGDIAFADHERYNLIIECKYYRNVSLENVFPVCSATIDDWIQQSLDEQARYVGTFGKIPLSLIIFSKPHNPNPATIITNDIALDALTFSHITFSSNRFNRMFALIALDDIAHLLQMFNLPY